jgi:FAD/FMN-containing dehydrogenase
MRDNTAHPNPAYPAPDARTSPGTGHNAAPMGPLAGTMLIKTSRMRGLTIDPAARIARAEAGVIWLQAAERGAQHGLAALAGSSPDVGVAAG